MIIEPKQRVLQHLANGQMSAVMCIYMRGKPFQIFTKDMASIQESWKKKILEAEKVLIIGVRPNMIDRHIWENMSKTNAKIAYVGSKDEFLVWKRQHRVGKEDMILGEKWADCFRHTVSFLQ